MWHGHKDFPFQILSLQYAGRKPSTNHTECQECLCGASRKQRPDPLWDDNWNYYFAVHATGDSVCRKRSAVWLCSKSHVKKCGLHGCSPARAKEHGAHSDDQIRGEEHDNRAGRRPPGHATKSFWFKKRDVATCEAARTREAERVGIKQPRQRFVFNITRSHAGRTFQNVQRSLRNGHGRHAGKEVGTPRFLSTTLGDSVLASTVRTMSALSTNAK